MHTIRLSIIGIVLAGCVLIGACSLRTESIGPRFTGRLLLLAGGNANGADLVELTAAPAGSTYNYSVLTNEVFEAAPSPDQTHLLYAKKDEIFLRDLRTGDVKSLVKGETCCLAWSPDGKRFSYKQRPSGQDTAPINKAGVRAKLFVSDLDGKTKLIWEDPFADYSAVVMGQAFVVERAAGTSDCAHWIAPDRLVFDRFLGAFPKEKKGGEVLKPNTTTIATVGDTVKFRDTDRKWSIESICQAGSAALLRPHDQAQPPLVAKSLEHLETLDPSPVSCSDCRFVGFAAQTCVPFFIEQTTSTSTDLFSLNPTNWQRQRASSIQQTFSPNAKFLIKSSAKLMIAGDAPDKLLLIDTESGDLAPLPAKSSGSEQLMSPMPIVWIEEN